MTDGFSCMRCKGELVEGFVVDNSHLNQYVSNWAEGPPNRTWLGSLKNEMRTIRTFRCVKCGFLESFAQ
jgi:hypothetical protein